MLPAVALAATAGAAQAELGGTVASIEGDRVRMVAHAARTATAPTYSSTTMTTASGGSVVEYAGTDGIVFAITWAGPARPDLRQLLGTYFGTFQSDAQAQGGRVMQRRLIVSDAGLVVHSAGHPGAFRGFAYLPDRTPQGFVADAVQ